MKKSFLLLFIIHVLIGSVIIVIFPIHTYANHLPSVKIDEKVKGKITDKEGQPLASATIKLIKSGQQTLSAKDGTFSIKAHKGDILEISCVGYQTTTHTVNLINEIISITLTEAVTDLKDVIVVGYGTQNKNKVTGAVTKVGLDHLSSRSLNSVGEALQGKAAGVFVTNEGGDPTNTPSVKIRGLGGLNGETPLYVVDGSIISGTPVISPNDVASIAVLKDASAAIYGARASGGVILVTTKKGEKGALSISLDAKRGFQSAWRKLQPLNAAQKAQVMNLAADNAGIDRDPAYDASVYPDGQITRTNWIDEVFRNGVIQDYNLGISGGNENSNMYISFDFRDQQGIILNTQSQRYNFRVNSEHQITNWLKLGEQMSYAYTNGNTTNTSSGYTGTLLSAIYYPTNVTPYTSDGNFSGLPPAYAGSYGDVINPVAELKRLDINNPINTIIINPYAEIKLFESLKFRSNLSFTKSFDNYKQFTPRRPEIGKPVMTNSLTESNSVFTDLLTEQTLNYSKTFDKHHLDAIAGLTYQKISAVGNALTGTNFDDESPAYRYLINATQIMPPTSTVSKTALASQFLRASYDYDNKYLLSAVVRRDGTSLLLGNNKTEMYYSVSGGWVLSRENFMKNIHWLSNLKLRGSYGLLGNLGSLSQQDVSPLLNRYNVAFGNPPSSDAAYYESIASSPNLRWANAKQSNVGLDAGLLKNRISLTADYFIKDVDRMILNRPLPGITGLTQQTINAGLIRDKGFELGIGYHNNPTRKFQYSVDVSMTQIQNNVLALSEEIPVILSGGNFRDLTSPVRTVVGQALFSYYVVKNDGVFNTEDEVLNYKNANGELIQPNAKPGDMRFIDANSDGAINNNDRQFVGSNYPKLSYGISFNASYKGFDFNLFMNGVAGNKIFNALKYSTLNAATGQSYNLLTGILDAWSPENPNSTLPRISKTDPNGNFSTTSDFYLENGSYLRVRNITLGYTLPQNIVAKIKSKSIRVYVTTNNLLTLTKYTGFDPEIGLTTMGIDGGRYPQARTFMIGTNVTF